MKLLQTRYVMLLLLTWPLVTLSQLQAIENKATGNLVLTATILPSDPFEIFPTGLVCSEIQRGSGPTWEGITIGESHLSDLHEQLPDSYIVSTPSDMLAFRSDTTSTYFFRLCEENGVITALQVDTGSQPQPLFIQEFLTRYGLPDVVTFSANPVTRVAFWFEEGIAVEIFAQGSDPQFFGRIVNVIYFPFQSVEGFESRWPYNRTLETVLTGDFVDEPPIPEEQNPFDFDMMLATITAEPSRTPTPTFAPLVSTPNTTTAP